MNMWSRLIPVEVMNTMMWQGNVYSMSSETVTLLSGDISRNTYTYNVSGKNVCLVVLSVYLSYLKHCRHGGYGLLLYPSITL